MDALVAASLLSLVGWYAMGFVLDHRGRNGTPWAFLGLVGMLAFAVVGVVAEATAR